MVESLHGLATIPARPPTPPKDTDLSTIDQTTSGTKYLTQLLKQSPNTPDESPSSSGDYFNKSLNKKPKRVDFSPWIEYKPPHRGCRGSWDSGQQIRLIPPSKECRSSRSILKSYDAAIQSRVDLWTTQERTFPEMLDDVCRGLASTSRSSRLDAYMTLNNCLKAYKDTPDLPSIEEKMTLLADFLRRDLSTDITDTGFQDMQLLTQALKLVTTFLWTPDIAAMFQDEFCSFLLDRSIGMIGDPNTTKALVNHYMFLLATQNFRPKIMTNERASRLLDGLKEITSYVKGNSVVGQRLVIYRRLLSQARPLMVSRVNDWIDHLFSGMLSTIKEVRSRALVLGMEGASTLGSVSQVSRAVQDIFNRRSSEGAIFLELLSSRLNGMFGDKDECQHVPQIWSVVILFLRSRRGQLEHWEHMKSWLGIIQRCFNSSDSQVKFQASTAWNRFVFAVHPNIATGQSMIKMLRQPILPQLDRKNGGKPSRQAKQVAYSSYCNLLYYAFRPGATHAQIDKFWQEYIDPILPGNILTAKVDMDFACQVLISLLGDTHQKVWSENRANEEGLIKPDELPRLDPKWARQRAAKVLCIFDSIFASIDWRSVENGKHCVFQAWRSFTKALEEAGSKEVKISMECMGAVAQIMNSIRRLWLQSYKRNPPAKESQRSMILQNIIALVDGAITDLGIITFTEKRLVQSSQELYEATETPSNRPSRHHGTLSSPIIHLMEMLTTTFYNDEAPMILKQAITDLIQISLRGSTSRRPKLVALRDMLHLTRTETLPASAAKVVIWQSIVEALELSLSVPRVNNNAISSPQPVGQDYKEIVKILEVGLLEGFSPKQSWPATMRIVTAHVRQEVGAGGVILAIIEPLTSFLSQGNAVRYYDIILQCGSGILNGVVWPESRREMELTHSLLWGTGVSNAKAASANPYNHLYTFIDSSLAIAYRNFNTLGTDILNGFLQGLNFVIISCPAPLSGILLQRIQQGLALWIEDKEGLMNGCIPASIRVFALVQELWKAITKGIERFPKFNTTSLSAIEVLISASLSSRHRSILNESITLWDKTFGLSQDLEYSEGLLKTLLRLRQITDIAVPNFNVEEETKHDSTPFEFIESLEEEAKIALQNPTQSNPALDTYEETASITSIDSPNHRSQHTRDHHRTPETSPLPRISELTPTPRLRHDNSQIEFAAIDSSPYDLEALESQFLTTRQKEVKERQRREGAAMFPDLVASSKPKLRTRDEELPKLYLRSQHNTEHQNATDETSSPALPSINNVMIDAFAEVSPTPRSRRYSIRDPPQDNSPPSSPPISNYDPNLRKILRTSGSPNNAFLQDLKATTKQQAAFEGQYSEKQKVESAEIMEKLEDSAQIICSSPRVIYSEPIVVESPIGRVEDQESISEDENIPSEMDVYMDARSSPRSLRSDDSEDLDRQSTNLNQKAHDRQEIVRTTGFRTISPSSGRTDLPREQPDKSTKGLEEVSLSITSNDDEQISAQIAMDMERALSQITPESDEFLRVSTPREDGNKKRKQSSKSPPSSTKKYRSSSGVQVVIERQLPAIPDEEVFDCIVVAPKPAMDRQRSNSVQGSEDEKMKETSNLVSELTTSPRSRKRSLCEGDVSKGEESSCETPITPSKKQKRCNDSSGEVTSTAGVAPLLSPANHRRSPRFKQVPGEDIKAIAHREEGASPKVAVMDPITTMAELGVQAEIAGFVNASEARGTLDGDLEYKDLKQLLTQWPSNKSHKLARKLELPGKGSIAQRNRKRVDPDIIDQIPSDASPPPPRIVLDSQANPHSSIVTCHLGVAPESVVEADRILANDQEMPITGESILDRLKVMLRDAKEVNLTPGEGRDIMAVLLALGSELNEASGRSAG